MKNQDTKKLDTDALAIAQVRDISECVELIATMPWHYALKHGFISQEEYDSVDRTITLCRVDLINDRLIRDDHEETG